ncbi:MAG: Phosphoribosylanthranilate isomerase [Paenibacillaceae bacterium]|jgi:phosphoribosylanthranilate isomerase|nr:Phosphoribosylanthranilate isomerase [Paenibacillaceae bacterium]
MLPTVKICGIRTVGVLRELKELPITQIGFVFAPSKRRVTPEEAGELIGYLRSEGMQQGGLFRSAGVFVNPDLEELRSVLASAPLDIVQLHGRETPEFCRQVKEELGVVIFKAVTLPEGEGAAGSHGENGELTRVLEPYVPYIDAFLLDTYDPVSGGGSGRTFSWEAIAPIRDWARSKGRKLIVAGGLHADNVQELLRRYEPDGVDVSSGVETDGVKDAGKIRLFMKRVEQG